MMTLQEAIQFAAKAHAGALDKIGQPYILHPLRVMMRLKTVPERITAVLHDVIEDTGFTMRDLLNEGLDPALVHSLELVTHRKGVPAEEYLHEIKSDPIALAVKKADLDDNEDPERVAKLKPEDRSHLAEKYKLYHKILNI